MARQVLKLRRFLQEKNSKDCGPVCVRMVLDHFGIAVSTQDLAKKLRYSAAGTSLFDNGRLVLAHGLSSTIVTANPPLFYANERAALKTQSAILKHVTELIAGKKLIVGVKRLNKNKKNLIGLKKFLEEGGRVRVEIPSISHVKEAIAAGKLVVALLYGRAYGRYEGGYHFVVVNGYDDKHVYVVNPLPGSKMEKVLITDFFYGLYTSTNVDIDNGSLLIVGKK